MKYRTYLLILSTAVFAVALAMPGPFTRTSRGQGKGGEVIAKPTPTPTPKKTTAPKHTTSANRAPKNEKLNRLGRLQVTNQAGITLIWIPRGEFLMGSNNGNADERPVHRVTIGGPDTRGSESTSDRIQSRNHGIQGPTPGFYMGRYEVTQEQWQAVMGENPSFHDIQCGNCPVERVSWNDVQNYLKKLNEINDGLTYRLPTEAEWEYACRAGTTGDYSGDLDAMAWRQLNTGAVGSMRPNAFGLYDMHGNVAEWCQDWYHETYYGAPSDGSAWLIGGEQKERVVRGGSVFEWVMRGNFLIDEGRDLRSARRRHMLPTSVNGFTGFRVVAVPR